MKLTINGYEVEIKAKHTYESRVNKKATMDLLNLISIWASAAAKWTEEQSYPALAESYENAGDEIYKVLAAEGLYNK